jgi:simple sugar transport system substrate-binding protein/basic membrane protein A
VLTALLAACSSSTTTSTGSTGSTGPGGTNAPSNGNGPGKDATKVGFIFVGPKDDYGYNQAAYQGSQAVAKAYPDMEVLTAENVPEDDNATRVMEDMIDKGATIIFATSYGHLDAAIKVAEAHPEVVVVQQGNMIKGTILPNTGTYFGTVYEPVYLAGIAAGKATKSNKLGYVYAFPIPQTIANINAFQLGAASVNPAAQTYVVNTSNWCDPSKQAGRPEPHRPECDVITHTRTQTITKRPGGRHQGGRLPRRRLVARPERLADRLGVGLGQDVHRHREGVEGGQLHRQQVQRQLPGRLQDR